MKSNLLLLLILAFGYPVFAGEVSFSNVESQGIALAKKAEKILKTLRDSADQIDTQHPEIQKLKSDLTESYENYRNLATSGSKRLLDRDLQRRELKKVEDTILKLKSRLSLANLPGTPPMVSITEAAPKHHLFKKTDEYKQIIPWLFLGAIVIVCIIAVKIIWPG